jgi:hypothetical protein
MSRLLSITTIILLLCDPRRAPGAPPDTFQPDPHTIQRCGPAYRYPRAGWIVLHIEGKPYDRGYQHGRLLAAEIASYLRCHAATQCPKAPAEAWGLTRTLANAAFLRRFDAELLREMQGIADGASAGGAKFDDRAIDLIDIAALNLWAELMTLDGALRATPTGLEGEAFPRPAPRRDRPPAEGHCSAFAATGPATADGKIVFGHISMFELYPSSHFNVWLDLQPADGHRVVMQTYPAGIYSGMDYYLTSAGMLVCETTIEQTRFNPAGETLASRMRRAVQYGDSIDAVVKVLTGPGNGLYTNEWLIGDTKTNEIAMLELGTETHRLWRSSRDEWFGGTKGFYWGCNNMKDLRVRMETLPAAHDRPAALVWSPSDRDKAWIRLYEQHKGKIDLAFARRAFTTPPLCAFPSLDAKYTSTELARQLSSWALFGPPMGRAWMPTPREMRDYPEVGPMVSNPWALMTFSGLPETSAMASAVDLPDKLRPPLSREELEEERDRPPYLPAWHGTLLPKADADIWLAAGFAELERIVSHERGRLADGPDDGGSAARRHEAAAELFAARSRYLFAAAAGDIPLEGIQRDPAGDRWYQIASGKGVLLLHELRMRLGDDAFVDMMDAFGRQHAGKEVSAETFIAHARGTRGADLDDFFAHWLRETGLPRLAIASADVKANGKEAGRGHSGGYTVEARLSTDRGPLPAFIEVALEPQAIAETHCVSVDPRTGAFAVDTTERPQRMVVDPFGRIARANGGAVGIYAFIWELDEALIIRGTLDEAAANASAAEALQRRLREHWSNHDVPILADTQASDADLRRHHLFLVGRPATNSVSARFESAFPARFFQQSVEIDRQVYGHAATAVCLSGRHPDGGRHALTLVAGLSGASTFRAASSFAEDRQDGQSDVLILEHGQKPRFIVVPAPDLVRELTGP